MNFTLEQRERFINHLIDCHSWYKHLSLKDGGLFIVTIDENAGNNYSTQHPKLPFGNSYEAYKEAFGNLTYIWKSPDDLCFYSDDRDHNYLPNTIDLINIKSEIKLYPYMSNDFIESISFHEHDFIDIVKNMEHEEYSILKDILNQYKEYNNYWNNAVLNNSPSPLNIALELLYPPSLSFFKKEPLVYIVVSDLVETQKVGLTTSEALF